MGQTQTDAGTIKSDRTLMAILQELHESGEAGVTELSDHIDVTKGAIHKHLKTLEELNYVVNQDGQYTLGLKFFNYGAKVKENYELSHLLERKVTDLVERTNEIVAASLEEHGKGTFIDIQNDRYNLNRVSDLGGRFHLNVCASGKAMLAEFSDEEIREIINQHGLPKTSENTITTEPGLFEEIETIREQNYATNLEEFREGMSAVGAAVYHVESDTVGALSISGPSHRLTREKIQDEYAEDLLEAVNELELQMNYG